MRYLIFALVLSSCGDGPQVGPTDMTIPTLVDLAELKDLVQLPSVPDMTRMPCTQPFPGVYEDALQFNYAPLSNPTMVSSTQAITFTVVRNDGTLWRPSPAIPTPFDYHCDFTEKSVDAESCMAPCCAGQVGSPMLYFDRQGWVQVINGVCTFQTTSAVTYSATIVSGAGSLVH